MEIETRKIDHKGLMETPCGGGWYGRAYFTREFLILSIYVAWKQEESGRGDARIRPRYFDMIYRGWNGVNEGTV